MGCCQTVQIVEQIQTLTIDNFSYSVKIHYCKNCGSLKSTSSINEIKNDNKTKY